MQSLTLPNNRNIVIVAMSLSTSAAPLPIPGTYVYTPPAGTVPAAGTDPLNVTFTPTDIRYGTSTATVNLVVNKAPLTVAANNETVLFGAPIPPYTDTITGFVHGDTLSVVTGSASLTTTPANPTAVNTYPITAAQGTLAAANYSFAFVPGTLSITKGAPTITWNTPASITYGTALTGGTAGQLNATASVLEASHIRRLSAQSSASEATSSRSPSPPPTPPDYRPQTARTLVVNKATLTMTAASQTVVYGTALAPYTYTITGFVNGDTQATATTGSAALSTSPATPVNVGSYPITTAAGTLASNNYSFTLVNGSVTISAATLTVSANNASRPYNTPNPAFTGSLAGAVNGDVFTESFSTTAVLGSAAGTYPITPAAAGANLANYTVVTSPGVLTVTQVTPVLSWIPASPISYGTALGAAQLNATVTGAIPGTLVYTPASGAVLPQGPQTLSVTFTPSDPIDYKPVTQTVHITVNKAVLTVTAASQTVVYGTALAPYSYTITGFVNGDTQATATTGSAALSTSPATPVNVGSYPITTAAGTLASSNYSFTLVNGSVTITPATLTVSANNASRPYNTPNPAFTGSIAGAVNGDVLTESFSTTAVLGSAAGTYPITPAAAGANLGNYTVVTSPGVLTVTQVTPVLSWVPASPISYGTALGAAQLNATVAGGLSGTLVYTPASGAVLAQGLQTLSVTFTPSDLVNYKPVTQTVQITVNKAVLTVTAASQSVVYGTALAPYTYSIAGFVNGDSQATATTGSAALSTSPATPVNVGSYPITTAAGTLASSNYSFTLVNGSVTITKATLTVTADNASRAYTAATRSSREHRGPVNGQLPFTESSTTAMASSPVGTYPITPWRQGPTWPTTPSAPATEPSPSPRAIRSVKG